MLLNGSQHWEYIFRIFFYIQEGHTITVEYLKKVFYIDIVKTEPAPVVDILNVNLNVEFEQPLDYVEPSKNKMEVEDIERQHLKHHKPNIRKNCIKKYKKTNIHDVQKFRGTGNRLGNK